jgi:hypothetical protein
MALSPPKAFTPTAASHQQERCSVASFRVKGRTLQIRPRYTSDTLKVTLTPNARLMRQIAVDPGIDQSGTAGDFLG